MNRNLGFGGFLWAFFAIIGLWSQSAFGMAAGAVCALMVGYRWWLAGRPHVDLTDGVIRSIDRSPKRRAAPKL